jgi:hypothetical protein
VVEQLFSISNCYKNFTATRFANHIQWAKTAKKKPPGTATSALKRE